MQDRWRFRLTMATCHRPNGGGHCCCTPAMGSCATCTTAGERFGSCAALLVLGEHPNRPAPHPEQLGPDRSPLPGTGQTALFRDDTVYSQLAILGICLL